MPGSVAALVHHPKTLQSVFFETQRDDETLKLLLRRHFITNFKWIFNTLILSLIPILVIMYRSAIVNFFDWQTILITWPLTVWIAIALLYYTILFFFAFLKFLDWYFNVLIVTNRRIIDLNYIPPFARQTTQAELEEIQDIRHVQTGAFAVLFDYGNIYIQTAGTQQNILLRYVPKPNVVHDMIVDLLP